MTTYNTGMKMTDRNVDASMPPATAVPTDSVPAQEWRERLLAMR